MPTLLSKALRSLTRSEATQVMKASRGTLTSYVLNAPPEYGQPRPEIGDINGLISPERMRELVQKTPTPAACVNATVDFSIGVDILPKAVDPRKAPDPAKVRYLQQLLNRPNTVDSRRHFLRQIAKDLTTIGWAAVEIEPDASGNVANLWVLDSARLYVDFDQHGDVLGYDMMDASGFPIHGPDHTHAWLPSEIIFFRLDPQTNSIYPSSRIQQLFPAAVVENLMLAFIGERFTDNNIPYGVFDLGDLTPDEIRKSVAEWNAQARANHRIIITGSKGASKFFPFGYALKELEAKDLLNEIRAFEMGVVGVTMNELGQSQDINKSNGYNLSYTFKKRAVEPLLGEICDTLTRRLIVETLGWDDVCFGYAEIDSRDELLQAQIDEAYVKVGGETINSVLNRRGLPSVKGGDTPMVFTGSAYIPVSALSEYAEAQLAVLRVAAQPTPAPGASPSASPGASGAAAAANQRVKLSKPRPYAPIVGSERFPSDDTKGGSETRVRVMGATGPNQSPSRGTKDAAKRAGVRND